MLVLLVLAAAKAKKRGDDCVRRVARFECERRTGKMLASNCRAACVSRGLLPALMSEDPEHLSAVGPIEALIEAGAEVNATDPEHLATPLHVAAANENVPVLRLLLRAGDRKSVV